MNNITKWTDLEYKSVLDYLNINKEEKYKEFTERIITTKYEILGVRTPKVRQLAKQIKNIDVESFINLKNKKYYEEILLEAFVIGHIKDTILFEKCFNKYIDKIDCWSLCDSAASSFKIVKNNKEYFIKIIKELTKSKKEYHVRMGLVLLLNYYIEKEYINEIFNIIDSINREEYYINMAIAWLLSMCYVKESEITKKYLKTTKINDFTYNKTISKINDSYQVTKEEKEKLKKTKRKSVK